ncbi:MAG: hypothetical protein LC130_35975, partial [Bryobacterales bacterium]|nr:hypothetical protein [Bryobacterales bacterium]
MRHRIGTSLAVIIVSLLGSGLQAQSHAPGATTTGALFDPTRPSTVIPSVLPSAIRHTTISSEEYYRRKQTLRQRAPVSIGPPGLELIDLLNTGRAPSSLPLQPLALSPSISF